ncbi:serine/threonine-protein phosphatase 6 regulatory ankyrin repeat subunit B [Halyomorpha halys]|uniref:serine/threonine-protein phosphatase 6 regulatory ankyrin repeat subunit B n=1 Tax=Halyomorpha halys TaxID=286706 RepID=UPI0006D4EDDB|nr:ankyrin-1 [Halyomorpha halys]XP_024218636.1 ankyrin-1-like [Halyomorpha halys]
MAIKILLLVILSLFGVVISSVEVNDRDKLWSSLTPLQLAAMEGRAEEVETILQEKREPVDGVTGMSPLHWAALRGHVPVIRVLLRFSADIHSLDEDNNTALHMAAVNGSADAVQELALAKVEIDAQNSKNYSALHIAVDKQHFDVVKMLLRFGALTNITDQEGRSPLDVAIEKNNIAIMKLLHTAGAEIFKYNKMKTTPKPTLATTTTKPAKATRRPELRKLTEKDVRMHEAAKKSLDTRIADLCAEGVNPNIADIDNNGYTPLHSAAAANGKVALLALARCSANLNVKDLDGNTPLHIAVIKDFPWSADILLMLGANPNVKNKDGKSPQDLVTSGKNKGFQATFKPERMKWISDVRPFSDSEQNLLRLVENGYYLSIADTCKDGVDVHAKDANHKQYTILHYAVSTKNNNAGTIQMLLRCGANINARDADGNTPLHLAVSQKLEEPQRVLLLNGADPYIANGDGKSVYQMLKESSPEAVDRLQWYLNSMPV